MFHASTPANNKDIILKSLVEPEGVVWVVFATVALGMGVNLKGVNTIIHYGAPQSIDDYFQESGRGGRSGECARSVVFWKQTDCPMRKHPWSNRDHEVAAVRLFLENETICRRQWLYTTLNHLGHATVSIQVPVVIYVPVICACVL
jgi:ATP-dependent DNA helicase RecQ